MIPEKSEKTDVEHIFSLLKAAQKSVIHVRESSNQNDTFDISTFANNDDADRPDPLRLPEVMIVIGVLLLWCGSIFIFIRHSELLRIRHRDLPFNSSLKPSIDLNHITVANRTSDMFVNSKSGVSSTGGLTPPVGNHMSRDYKQDETIETISLTISPLSKRRRHTHSYDFHRSLPATKYSSNKHGDKEHLLHPHRILSDRKENFLNLHRKSADNAHRQSMDNLSTIKYSIFYSTNDMLTHKHSNSPQLTVKKRCIQESPV